ncbi:MAG: hypothetical protein ACI92I_000589 [Acidimicrobiales bacterium]|jgi:hypothetical protein
MFFNLVTRLLLALLFTVVIGLNAHAAEGSKYVPMPLPPGMEKCAIARIGNLLLAKDAQEAQEFFLKYSEQNKLGSNAYGGFNWKQFSPKEREVALDLYFNIIYKDTTEATDDQTDLSKTVFDFRLADNPVVKESSGLYHIIASIKLSNKPEPIVAVFITTNTCDVVDIGKGAFASRFVDAGDVDRAMRELRKNKK